MLTSTDYFIGLIILLVIVCIFLHTLLTYEPCMIQEPRSTKQGFYPVHDQPFMLEQINDMIENNELPPYTYPQSAVAKVIGDLEFGRDWVAITPQKYKDTYRSSRARGSLIKKAKIKAQIADYFDPLE